MGGMDTFKYIGDENLIFSDDEEEDEENDKLKEQYVEMNTKPMENVFEIVLNNKIEKKEEEVAKEQEVKQRKKINKKFKWIKYYI